VPKSESFSIAQIYVPMKRRGAVSPQLVRELAESILQIGQQTPILVRRDADRLVLVEGLHRLEACRALGEETIIGCVVDAQAARPRHLSAYETDAEAVRHKMDRLRALRLEKQAAAGISSTPAAPASEAPATKVRERASRSGRSHSKPESLSDWLAERERDGFRR
jgi:ParB-like chromosome segregation protein Spo0J